MERNSLLKHYVFSTRVMDGPADDDHVVPPDAPPSVGLELRKMLDVDKPERKKRGTGIVTLVLSRPPTSISIIVIFDYHYAGEEDDWSIDGGNSSGELGGVGDLDYQSIGQLETDFLDKQHDFSEHAELNSDNTLIGKNPWSLLITVEQELT